MLVFHPLCCLRAVLRVTQIRGLTGSAWPCTRKVIRAASVSNPCEYKTLPISVRLDGERWNARLVSHSMKSSPRSRQFPTVRRFLSFFFFFCVCVHVSDQSWPAFLCACVLLFVFTLAMTRGDASAAVRVQTLHEPIFKVIKMFKETMHRVYCSMTSNMQLTIIKLTSVTRNFLF